jgi:hypothetical protein
MYVYTDVCMYIRMRVLRADTRTHAHTHTHTSSLLAAVGSDRDAWTRTGIESEIGIELLGSRDAMFPPPQEERTGEAGGGDSITIYIFTHTYIYCTYIRTYILRPN